MPWWYILWPFGIFDCHLLYIYHGYLVHFVVIWYLFFNFGMPYQKNLATLVLQPPLFKVIMPIISTNFFEAHSTLFESATQRLCTSSRACKVWLKGNNTVFTFVRKGPHCATGLPDFD
jgi:hypothetical protein